MPNGGRLIIETSDETLDDTYLLKEREGEIVPGRYVLFSLTDAGSGIDEDKKEHLFDPFFTTKSKGKGTGLGLSIVQRLSELPKHAIHLESRLGKGSVLGLSQEIGSSCWCFGVA